jgi:feruloyl-CoA synthase
VFLAERHGSGWREITYAAADRLSGAIGENLLRRGLDRERPILILGEASCAQGLLRLAALRAGIPFVPASPAVLRFGGPEQIRALIGRLTPGAIALSPASLDLLPAELSRERDSLLALDDTFLQVAGTEERARTWPGRRQPSPRIPWLPCFSPRAQLASQRGWRSRTG